MSNCICLISRRTFFYYLFIISTILFTNNKAAWCEPIQVIGLPGIELGMQLNEVKEALHGFQITLDNTKVIIATEFNGFKFSTTLLFNDENQLFSVSEVADLKNISFEDAYKVYNKIGKNFVMKYGSPDLKSLFSTATVKGKWCSESWSSNGTRISLRASYLASSEDFTIEYYSEGLSKKPNHATTINTKNQQPDNKAKVSKQKNSDAKLNHSQIDILFAGIKWLSTEEAVNKSMLDAGYTFKDEHNFVFIPNFPPLTERTYSGTIAGNHALIDALFDDQGLLFKILITLDTIPDYFNTYLGLVVDLQKKYGLPWAEIQKYQYPYTKGDGFRDTAIKLEKAFFGTTWAKEANYLELYIDKRLSIILDYKTHDFSCYLDMRKAQTQKNL